MDFFRKYLTSSSHSRMFLKIGVLKNFVNFSGKHLCHKRLQHRCFSAKFAKNTFYTEQHASGDYSNKRLFKTLKFWCSSIQTLNVFLKCDSIYY